MTEQTDDRYRLRGLKELAAYLGTDWRNVRDLVETGELPCVRVGPSREPRVALATLDAWLRRLGEAGADRASNRPALSNLLSKPPRPSTPVPLRATPKTITTSTDRARS